MLRNVWCRNLPPPTGTGLLTEAQVRGSFGPVPLWATLFHEVCDRGYISSGLSRVRINMTKLRLLLFPGYAHENTVYSRTISFTETHKERKNISHTFLAQIHMIIHCLPNWSYPTEVCNKTSDWWHAPHIFVFFSTTHLFYALPALLIKKQKGITGYCFKNTDSPFWPWTVRPPSKICLK